MSTATLLLGGVNLLVQIKHEQPEYIMVDGELKRQIYMAQCMNGHAWEIEQNSGLERLAIERNKRYLDAICVPCEECEECKQMAENQGLSDRIKYGYSLQEMMDGWEASFE